MLDSSASVAITLQTMFRTASNPRPAAPIADRPTLAERRRFAAALFAFLLLLFCVTSAKKTGDFPEYGIMTIAFAAHGTPDIRIADIQKARRMNPETYFSDFYQGLEDGVRAHALAPAIAFYRGRDERHYAIHFFAYSALAALPFAVFEAVGIPPWKCYQFVNLACIYLLGMVCLRFFGSRRRAAAALGLFFLCGGALYWNWSSAEVMTAVALLAGLMLYLGNAPVLAGLLVGLASMQNPPALMFAGFAPLLHLLYRRSQAQAWRAAWKEALALRRIAALALLVLLFLVPIAFNYSKFGVPSLIAAGTTNLRLISGLRLFSLFFDLNQGMLIGVPALFASMALILVFARSGSMRLLAGGAILFSVAMAVPALSTHNWNSGAAGMMRYAFWAAMPFLLTCLLYARGHTVPRALIVAVFMVQAGATLMERGYRHVEFNRLAKFAMAKIPSMYNPVFEIFSERLQNQEGFVPKDRVLVYEVRGQAKKIAFNLEQPGNAARQICGMQRRLSLDSGVARVDDGWAYLNTPPVCILDLPAPLAFGAADFDKPAVFGFGGGWGQTEFGGANWDGRWTTAPLAQFTLALPANAFYTRLSLCGQYVAPGVRTEVSVNGHALGVHALDRCAPIAVPVAYQDRSGRNIVELRHPVDKLPSAANGDPRRLGFFLTKIGVE